MGKLIIENIIIEKSDKDIKTGINYNFSEGLNLICGDNEAGKSSLMKFIKEGFFRVKGIDTGKIYFSIIDNENHSKYRTDIKDHRSQDQRCKLYDENNSEINYGFIEKTINQRYFEQGFTINLDDLMNIQNKDTSTLIDIIKDPSGEKLSDYIEKVKTGTKKILGDNGRLTKETNSILDKISLIDFKIKELSNKESLYNDAVQSIKAANEELDEIFKYEEYLNLSIKAEELKKQLNTTQEEYNSLYLNFNEKFFKDRETYLSILHNAGKYESNLSILAKQKEKLDVLMSKINLNMNCLNSNFAININESDVVIFALDYSKIKQIKDLISSKAALDNELIVLNANKENLEENILKLKHYINPLKDKILKKEEFEKLNGLYKFIDEKLKQYNFLLSKINNAEKNTKINASGINANRNLLILFSVLFIMTVLSAVISFYQKVPIAGIFAVMMAVISASGFATLKIASYKDRQDDEINKDEEEKNNLLNLLKEKIKDYYNEIDNVESSYLPLKIDSIKQEIGTKIQSHVNMEEIIVKSQSEFEYNSEKSEKLEEKLNQLKIKIDEIENQIKNLIQSEENNFKIDEKIYPEVIDIIKVLKEDIKEKNIICKEIEELSNENNKILNVFNSFILNNEINISLSEKYEDNIGKIKAENEKNSGIKNQLDILLSEIQSLQEKLNKLDEEKKQFNIPDTYKYNTDVAPILEELLDNKKEILNKKKEAEFKKRELESFEGLNDLKIQKNIYIDEYRKKIEELIKNKMVIALIEKAKNSFNETQPDLKNAQKYLSILTDGKYSKINLDMMEIQNEEGTITKKWQDLSRGTKEQLYLALRLGYASNYSRDKITLKPNGKVDLPLIIDDAFVNFDFTRTRNAIKCLEEFSKTNQVLFFSCHTDLMKKHFESLGSEFNIINL